MSVQSTQGGGQIPVGGAPAGASGGSPAGTTAKLGGVPLLGVGPVGWTITPGVEPSQRIFIVSPQEKSVLLARAGRPVDLELQAAVGGKVTITGLYILGEAIAPDPNHAAILVSDRRWKWGRTHVSRRYNMRRATGQFMLISDAKEPFQWAPDVQYAAFSTKDDNGTPWGLVDMLNDVMTLTDPTARVQFKTNLGSRTGLVVEDVMVDQPGDEAVAYVLSKSPGVGIYLDANDNVIFYDTADGGESQVFKTLGAPIAGGGQAALVDVPLLRPVAIDVFFEREIEVRFDYIENSDSSVDLPSSPQLLAPNLENVLPVPDPTFFLANAVASEAEVGAGTWITFDDFFDSLPSNPAPALAGFDSLTNMDAGNVQESWNLGSLYARIGLPDMQMQDVLSTLYIARNDAVYQHYRQTFRVAKPIMDRVLALMPKRVALLNPSTGAYANAQVFANYAFQTPDAAWYAQMAPGESSLGAIFIANMTGYDPATKNCKLAPALVTIIDEAAGIFRVDYRLTPSTAGNGACYYPCQLKDFVSADPENSKFLLGGQQPLTAQHKLAVIMTVLPAAPNDKRQLYNLRISPDEAQPLLAQRIGDCQGPALEVRISGHAMTARFAWTDADAPAISKMLGIDAPGQRDGDQPPLDPINYDDLKALAKSFAAGVYAQYCPRSEGFQAGPLSPSATIAGRITAVDHAVLTDGRARTTAAASPLPPMVDPFATLPDAVRQLVRRLVRQRTT
jgi:hypothetical protein